MIARRLAAVAVSVLLVSAPGCGGSAKSAVKNALPKSGFEGVQGIKGSVDESGQLTVTGENGSKVLLDIVKEGGKFVIDACQNLENNGSSCSDVTLDQRLEP